MKYISSFLFFLVPSSSYATRAVMENVATSTGSIVMFNGSPWVDVKAYGATGNGSTNDALAIQNAINAAEAMIYPGAVYFPPGNYSIGSTIFVSTSIEISGAGPGSQENFANFTPSSILTWSGVSNSTMVFANNSQTVAFGGMALHDMSINCANIAGVGVLINGVNNSEWKNLNVINCKNANFKLASTNVAGVQFNRFSNLNGGNLSGNASYILQISSNSYNDCHNTFTGLRYTFSGSNPGLVVDGDNNQFTDTVAFPYPGATGYGIQIGRPGSPNGSNGANYFYHTEGSFHVTANSAANIVFGYGDDNGEGAPVIDAGSQLAWMDDLGTWYNLTSITNAAQVSVGTTSAGAPLVVNSSGGNYGNGIRLRDNVGGYYETITDGAGGWSLGKNSSDVLVINRAGKSFLSLAQPFGFGTSSPLYDVDILNGTDQNAPAISIRADFTGVGKYSMIRFGDQSQTTNFQKGGIIYEGINGQAQGRFHIALSTSSNSDSVSLTDARLTVTSDSSCPGCVGIGTTTPTSILSLYGIITSSTSSPTVSCTSGSPVVTSGSTSQFGSYAAGALATGCTVTFTKSFPKAPFCVCQASANLVVWASATATNSVTCTSLTAMTGDTITYRCDSAP